MNLLPYVNEEIKCSNCGSHEFKLRKHKKREGFVNVFCENCGQWVKFANKQEKANYLNLNNFNDFDEIKSAEIEEKIIKQYNEDYYNNNDENNNNDYYSLNIDDLREILYDLNALSEKLDGIIIDMLKR